MTNEVLGLNMDGDIVGVFKNFREVSEKTGYKAITLYVRNTRCIPSPDGIFYVKRDNYEKLKEEGDITKYFNSKTLKRVRRDFIREKKEKPVNHIIPYQTQGKIICITNCPFWDSDDLQNRPKVGGGRCARCSHFVSKDREKKEVRCSFNKFGVKGIPSLNNDQPTNI